MFHLEKEVRRWCRQVTPGLFFRGSYIAELEDHVHNSVAELVKRGTSEELAFRSVTKALGDVRTLRSELRKNRGLLSNLLIRIGRPSASKPQYVAAAMSLLLLVALGATLHSDVFVEWTENAIVAFYTFPMKWLGGAS